MLNAQEYMSIMNEQALNSGSSVYDFSKQPAPVFIMQTEPLLTPTG